MALEEISIRKFFLCVEKENCRIIECGLENIQGPPLTPSWWLLYKAFTTQNITHSISTYLCYWNCLVSLGSNKPSLETSGYALESFTKYFSNVTFHKSKKTVIYSQPKNILVSIWNIELVIFKMVDSVYTLKLPFPQCTYFSSFCQWVVY